MKKVSFIYFLTIIIFQFSSCKKSDSSQPQLIGKWKLDSLQLYVIASGQGSFQTFYKPTTDYFDFRSDNKSYRYLFLKYDTVPYGTTKTNDQLYITYAGRITDTVKMLTDRSLIFINPQGGATKCFFTRQ